MNTYEIYNKEYVVGNDTYNYIITQVEFSGVRRKSKFYEIRKNNETILSTSLHQTWYKYIRQIEKIKTILL